MLYPSYNKSTNYLQKTCRNNGVEVLISRVIDGDTLEFKCNGKKQKIRIIRNRYT